MDYNNNINEFYVRIISQREEDWDLKLPPLFIEMAVPSQEND